MFRWLIAFMQFNDKKSNLSTVKETRELNRPFLKEEKQKQTTFFSSEAVRM